MRGIAPSRSGTRTAGGCEKAAYLLSYSGNILGITHRHVSVIVLQAGRPNASTSSSRPAVPLPTLPPERTPAFLPSLREANPIIVLCRWKENTG